MLTAFIHLQKAKDELGLPYLVIEKTAYIYRKIQQRGLVRGRPIKIVVATSLYIVCREMEIPKTLTEFAEI